MKISIVIPAYNEENRIKPTLESYYGFFTKKKNEGILDFEIIVVINGTTDKTSKVVRQLQESMPQLFLLEISQSGKGLAIQHGFGNALSRANDIIGFVDADMATSASEFYKLIQNINGYDGIIASRYMKESIVMPARPFIKRWGSKLFFGSLVRLLFNIRYYDTQCGAKLFTTMVIKKILPYLQERQWAFDVELLYVARRFGFSIKELPTRWNDQAGSKLQIFRAGSRMLSGLMRMRWYYWRIKLNN